LRILILAVVSAANLRASQKGQGKRILIAICSAGLAC